jgi:predicted secreted protein
MNIVSAFVVFTMIWWIVFFIALPMGIERDTEPQEGNDSGAPKDPMIKKKMLYTTAITTLLTVIYYLLVDNELLSLSLLP